MSPHRLLPDATLDELRQIRYALDQSAIVATTDVPGHIKYVNDKFCEISKYPREELIGQDHRILNSGFHTTAFMKDLWRTIAHGRIWRGEIRNRAKDGSLYWVDTTIVPFVNDQGKPWQYMAIRYDITQRKAQEQRLLEQATLSSLGEMAAVLAHEVRNPLAGIKGGVQLLASLFPDAVEGREFIGDIVARIDSLNAVVGDLLTFARVRELKRVELDLSEFLDDVVAWTKLDPTMRDVQVVVHHEQPLIIGADVDQLRLVFTNLLLNAAQAMGLHGRIEIAVESGDRDEVVVAVSDGGPGIPVELRDRVLEPFFTTKHRGTGLGLPTARRIIDAHGGHLSIRCPDEGGTVIQIRLPRRSVA